MSKIPKLGKHKASGQARVVLSGETHYLGLFGSREAKANYDRLILEWIKAGRKPLKSLPKRVVVTISDLASKYAKACESIFVDARGKPTVTIESIRGALKWWIKTQGSKPVETYGLPEFREFRDVLANAGLARKTISNYVWFVRSALSWGEEQGLVPQSVLEAARLFSLPRRGPSAGRITERIKPIPETDFPKIVDPLPLGYQDYFRLLWLSGARAGEIVGLQLAKIDRSREVWRYVPESHKTSHRGQTRTILFGKRAQEIILRQSKNQPFLSSCDPKHSVNTWSSRFKKACERAGVLRYHQHQIRHSFATRIATAFGVEGARVLLGHSVGNAVTSIYAERDLSLAERIAMEIG